LGSSGEGSENQADAPFRKRVQANWAELTANERSAARFMLDSKSAVGFGTIREVASGAGVSERCVTRLIQKIGYLGFPELKREFRDEVETQLSSPILRFRRGAAPSDDLRGAWLTQATRNLETVARIPYVDLLGASNMIASASGSVYILGLGKGVTVAKYLWFAVNLLRPNVRLPEGSELEIVDQLLDLEAHDLTVICDFRRYPRAGSSLARLIGEAQPHVVVITDSGTSRFAMLANYSLVVSMESIFPTDDYLAAFGVAELLAGMMLAHIPGDAVARRLERYEDATAAGGLFVAGEDELRGK